MPDSGQSQRDYVSGVLTRHVDLVVWRVKMAIGGIGWKLHGDGKTPPPGEVVRPDERLSWGRT